MLKPCIDINTPRRSTMSEPPLVLKADPNRLRAETDRPWWRVSPPLMAIMLTALVCAAGLLLISQDAEQQHQRQRSQLEMKARAAADTLAHEITRTKVAFMKINADRAVATSADALSLSAGVALSRQLEIMLFSDEHRLLDASAGAPTLMAPDLSEATAHSGWTAPVGDGNTVWLGYLTRSGPATQPGQFRRSAVPSQ